VKVCDVISFSVVPNGDDTKRTPHVAGGWSPAGFGSSGFTTVSVGGDSAAGVSAGFGSSGLGSGFGSSFLKNAANSANVFNADLPDFFSADRFGSGFGLPGGFLGGGGG